MKTKNLKRKAETPVGGSLKPVGSEHPAFKRTWWLNLYPEGQCTGRLYEARESALNRCTYTGDRPDAVQVEVRIIPNAPAQRPPAKDV